MVSSIGGNSSYQLWNQRVADWHRTYGSNWSQRVAGYNQNINQTQQTGLRFDEILQNQMQAQSNSKVVNTANTQHIPLGSAASTGSGSTRAMEMFTNGIRPSNLQQSLQSSDNVTKAGTASDVAALVELQMNQALVNGITSSDSSTQNNLGTNALYTYLTGNQTALQNNSNAIQELLGLAGEGALPGISASSSYGDIYTALSELLKPKETDTEKE